MGRRRGRKLDEGWSDGGGAREGGGDADSLELMVVPGVGTHLLASLPAACRWLGDRFGAAPVGCAARPDAHEGVEHGLLMSP